MKAWRVIIAAAAGTAALACAGCGTVPPPAPTAVYLTWQRDPTTTMTVHWLSPPGQTASEITWRRPGGSPATASGTHRRLPYAECLVHTVELTGLDPDASYSFRIAGRGEDFRFRTLPDQARDPITFITGGDVYRGREIEPEIYRHAAALDPAFVVLGGDLVYDNGRPGRADRWLRWLAFWQETMVGSGGRLIPLVVAIGNHEVFGRYGRTPERAPFFYALFASPGPRGCAVLDFGSYMSLVVLDSGHTHSIEGAQTEWLEVTLAARRGRAHLFVAYHVPSHPSVRGLDEKPSPVIREHWVPLFERYGVDVVFESHDHAYKRTHPIRGGRVDPAGVVYLGDGGWGARPRRPHDPWRTWYLARAERVHSFVATTIEGDTRRHVAYDNAGNVIDTLP